MTTNLVARARAFAEEAHAATGIVRKFTPEGQEPRPYFVHVERVAQLVAHYLPEDEIAQAAAYCHDILEDVADKFPQYGAEAICELLGFEVLEVTIMLTDVYTSEAYPDLNRAKRKELEAARFAAQPEAFLPLQVFRAHTVKCCDLIDNTHDIVLHDANFARTYLPEKQRLLVALTKALPAAWDEATLTEYKARTELEAKA